MANPLFNIPVQRFVASSDAPTPTPIPAPDVRLPGQPPPSTPSAAPPSVAVFTSGQAVITFPAASALTTVVWKVLAKVFPSWGTSMLVPFFLALLIGTLIYFQSERSGKSKREQIIDAIFALLNSVTIAAAALGIDAATTS